MRKPNTKKALCHPDKPHYAKGLCTNCYTKQLKKDNPAFAKRQRANVDKFLKNNPDCLRQYKKAEIARKGGSTYQRKLDLKKLYGLTVEQYEEMLRVQNGCCAICKQPQRGKRKHLCVDHCHKSNELPTR